MFNKYYFNFNNNKYNQIINEISDHFEYIIEGRQLINIVKVINNLVPIVRTTTYYSNPSIEFTPLFDELINTIKEIVNIDNIDFNNGMIELYNSKYTKMKYHSDQSLDLENNSYICICSFYNNINSDVSNYRKLIIQNKLTKETNEIILEPNCFIIFSTETNKNYLHKIILNNPKSNLEWLGVTFRLSKTFINFNNIMLRVANENESKEFRKLKGIENQFTDFIYPNINYTLNSSDLIYPIKI